MPLNGYELRLQEAVRCISQHGFIQPDVLQDSRPSPKLEYQCNTTQYSTLHGSIKAVLAIVLRHC